MSLRWIVYPQPHLHSLSLAVALHGGPRYEGKGEQGRTHFLEHMLFRGAGERASLSEVMAAFEEVGSEPEAYTSEDGFMLLLDLDPSQGERGVALLADLLLRPRWSDLESERAVIEEERLERVDDEGTPTDLDDVSLALAFPGHPAGRSILGRRRDIAGVSQADLESWRERLVVRENLALAVAGPVSPDDVARWLSPLDAIPAGAAPDLGVALPDPDGPRFAFHRAEGPQTQLRFSFRGPGQAHPDYPTLALLVDLLDGGPTSRLPARLVDSGLCYSGRGELVTFPDASLVTLEVSVAHKKVGEVLRALRALCEGFAQAVAPEELARAAIRRGHDARRLKDDTRSLAEWGARRLLTGLETDPEAVRAAEAAVTAAAVEALAARVLHPARLSVAAFAPEGRTRKAIRREVEAWSLSVCAGGRA